MNEADQIIEQCRAIAVQHYPDKLSPAFALYYAQLLETKIRELLYRAPALQVRDTMPAEVLP